MTPRTAELAFQSGRNGHFEIFTSEADGSDPVDRDARQQLNNLEPSWSSDSFRIAFASDRTGGGDIYVMDFDGSNVRRLTSDAASERHPTWSPDGRQIAFERAGRIQIMDVDPEGSGEGTNLHEMNPAFPAAQSEPDWSPVGNKIAYTQLRGTPLDPDPLVFDLDKNEVTGFLTGNGAADESPTWSPDGSQVIWTRDLPGADKDLFIRKADGSGIEQAITNVADGRGYATPAWQPAPKPAKPRPVPAPPAGGGGGTPPPAGEETDTRPDPGTAPAPIAFLGLDLPHRTTVKAFSARSAWPSWPAAAASMRARPPAVAPKPPEGSASGTAKLDAAKARAAPTARGRAAQAGQEAVRRALATRGRERRVSGRRLKATLTVISRAATRR